MRNENLKKLIEKRHFLQEKISKTLYKNESKMNEKINEYFEKQKKWKN